MRINISKPPFYSLTLTFQFPWNSDKRTRIFLSRLVCIRELTRSLHAIRVKPSKCINAYWVPISNIGVCITFKLLLTLLGTQLIKNLHLFTCGCKTFGVWILLDKIWQPSISYTTGFYLLLYAKQYHPVGTNLRKAKNHKLLKGPNSKVLGGAVNCSIRTVGQWGF